MMKRTFLLLFVCLFGLSAVSQAQTVFKDGKISSNNISAPSIKSEFNDHLSDFNSDKPPCPENPHRFWSNCFGARAFNNGHYTGEFQHDVPYGQGSFKNAEALISGEWKNGKLHGFATVMFADGETYIGELKNGVPDGGGVHTSKGGQTTSGYWKKGEFSNRTIYTKNYFDTIPDDELCVDATRYNNEGIKEFHKTSMQEIGFFSYLAVKRRGLSCDVDKAGFNQFASDSNLYINQTDTAVCDEFITSNLAKIEAKKRKLDCYSLTSSTQTQTGSSSSDLPACPSDTSAYRNNCFGTETFANGENYVGEYKDNKRHGQGAYTFDNGDKWVGEYKNNKKHGQGTYTYANGNKYVGEFKDDKRHGQGTFTFADGENYVGEFKDNKKHGQGTYTFANNYVKEGIWKDDVFQYHKKLPPSSSTTQIASSSSVSASSSSTVPSTQLTAAQRKAERLEAELAALKAAQQQEEQQISGDTQIPLITILSSSADDRRGSIAGRVTDNIAVAEVRVDGAIVPLKPNGSFAWQGFVPTGGVSVTVEAIDTAGLSTTKQVRLERGQLKQATGPSFARLDPFRGKAAKKNGNALALVIGVADYKYTSDPALYADKDAEYFHDYAAIKLGVPDNNIFTITNTEADEVSIKKAVKNWLLRMSAKNETDVYIFFAGHGLANSDGSNMFLLPYDGDPELLEDSAIDRKQLFADIQAISPRSVTVFLDSCYSGGTRSGGTLVASLRPIVIRAKEQNVPDGFTILSAAKGDQTSQSLEEAKHGLFSYFLMRGLEGDADANNDNQITAGELHSFVTDKVERQSGFKQTPDLQGDAGRILVRFE